MTLERKAVDSREGSDPWTRRQGKATKAPRACPSREDLKAQSHMNPDFAVNPAGPAPTPHL
eukprot:4515595-Pyramimonas_sp.AAC.1